MEFGKFRFGSIAIDDVTYEHDVVIDRGKIRKRKKKPSKKFRGQFGRTPVSIEEKLPWKCRRLVVRHGKIWIPSGDGRGEEGGWQPENRADDSPYRRSHGNTGQEVSGHECDSPRDVLSERHLMWRLFGTYFRRWFELRICTPLGVGASLNQVFKVEIRVSPKKAATKINAITTQSFIIYAVRLSSITVRAANENSHEALEIQKF
jgi:hypothetical protein